MQMTKVFAAAGIRKKDAKTDGDKCEQGERMWGKVGRRAAQIIRKFGVVALQSKKSRLTTALRAPFRNL